MKTLWEEILLALFMGVVLPGMILSGFVWYHQKTDPKNEEKQAEMSVPETNCIPVKLRSGNKTEEQELENYLIGVVLAEMPAYFEPEALKAQAVVARTYTTRAGVTGGKHGDGSFHRQQLFCLHSQEENYIPWESGSIM